MGHGLLCRALGNVAKKGKREPKAQFGLGCPGQERQSVFFRQAGYFFPGGGAGIYVLRGVCSRRRYSFSAFGQIRRCFFWTLTKQGRRTADRENLTLEVVSPVVSYHRYYFVAVNAIEI